MSSDHVSLFVFVSYGQLPELFVSRTSRSTTPSRRRVRERRAPRVCERRVGERLGESERLGDLLPEPPPFSFEPADSGERPRPFDDPIATR